MIRKTVLTASMLSMGVFAIAASALPVMAQSAASQTNQQFTKAELAKVSGSLLKLHNE